MRRMDDTSEHRGGGGGGAWLVTSGTGVLLAWRISNSRSASAAKMRERKEGREGGRK